MRIAYKSFTGGEITPSLSARYDINKYAVSTQCMENFVPGLSEAAESVKKTDAIIQQAREAAYSENINDF